MGGWMQTRKATFSSGKYKNEPFLMMNSSYFVVHTGSNAE